MNCKINAMSYEPYAMGKNKINEKEINLEER
jgi:hypothetical protein